MGNFYKDNIQITRDSSTNFNLANNLPLIGELKWETDTGRMKIGDGVQTYQNLGYMDQVGPHFLKSYTIAQANIIKTTSERALAWISDETGGSQPAYCDGINWFRFSDGAVIS